MQRVRDASIELATWEIYYSTSLFFFLSLLWPGNNCSWPISVYLFRKYWNELSGICWSRESKIAILYRNVFTHEWILFNIVTTIFIHLGRYVFFLYYFLHKFIPSLMQFLHIFATYSLILNKIIVYESWFLWVFSIHAQCTVAHPTTLFHGNFNPFTLFQFVVTLKKALASI